MPDDAAAAVRGIAKRAPAQAHVELGYLRRMYSWAICTVVRYGVLRFQTSSMFGAYGYFNYHLSVSSRDMYHVQP
jgi:hypothetical protein